MVSRYSPGSDEDAMLSYVEHIIYSGYTLSELRWLHRALAADKWVADQIAAKTQNPLFMLPAIDRLVQKSRRIRRQLTESLLTRVEVQSLVAQVPELSVKDFQRGGYDSQDNPLYRFATHTTSSEAQAAAKLWGRA